MPFDQSLNEVNQALLDKLKGIGVSINFEVDPSATCWNVQQKYCYRIASPDENPNTAAMAHELLHIELDMRGFGNIHRVYSLYNETTSIFTADFISRLDNTLAHYKMLDNFLKMGYHVDDFLLDTPKEYFLEGMLMRTAVLMIEHNAKIAEVCNQTREIVDMCAAAKLFEQYKIKDPTTKNGLHPEIVLKPLREINSKLVDGLVELLEEWNTVDSVDSLAFYYRLNEFLKGIGIPTEKDCKAAHDTRQ